MWGLKFGIMSLEKSLICYIILLKIVKKPKRAVVNDIQPSCLGQNNAYQKLELHKFQA